MKRFITTCLLLCISLNIYNVYSLDEVYLTVLGTEIDEKIVQSSDNTYYLDHNSINNKDIKGATFLDYRNNINDKKLLIYGHNSDTLKVPFKELENYLDSKYYKSHKYIFLTNKNETSIYKIFSIMITSNNEHTRLGFTNKKYINHLKYLKENSLYNTKTEVNNKDSILVIQTCNYNPPNTYIVISSKKMKGDLYEEI